MAEQFDEWLANVVKESNSTSSSLISTAEENCGTNNSFGQDIGLGTTSITTTVYLAG